MNVLVYGRLSEELQQMVVEAANNHRVIFANSEEDLVEEGTKADIFYGFCHEKMFQYLPNVKWIQSSSAGMDQQLFTALRNSEVILTNAAGLYATHVADQGFALLLGLARNIPSAVRNQDQQIWGRLSRPLIEIGELTIGMVGMGGIGQQMAKRAKGFDMYVISVDAYRDGQVEAVDELMGIDQLPTLMQRSDVVMIACPLTEETHHLINADQLARMKSTACLINVARGPIVDESALIEALRKGQIAAVGLDVTETEPLPSDSPLWSMDNVLITPHAAGQSQHRIRRATTFFCQNLKRYLDGEPLQNLVDKSLGF